MAERDSSSTPPQRGLEVKIGDRIVVHDQEGNFLEELKVDEIGPVEERRMGSVVITLHRFTAVLFKSGDEDDTSEVEHPLTAPYEGEDNLANVENIRDWFPRRTTPPDETQS